ncbi:MAG: hypothetical protein WD009_09780 [Phycisphaeraceae bacterium]
MIRRPHTVILLTAVLACAGLAAVYGWGQRPRVARSDVEPVALEVGPETTVVGGPLRDDGTVDYVAAINAILSEGVTSETNAFVEVARLIRPDGWPDEAYRARVFELLGVAVPGEEATYFVSMTRYAEERADVSPWDETVQRKDDEGSGQVELMTSLGFSTAASRMAWEVQWERALQGPWSADEAPLVAEWLDEQDAALDRLVAGLSREANWMPWVGRVDEAVVSQPLPALGAVRSMARGLYARAHRRLDAGDAAGAAEDMLAIKQISRDLASGVLLIEHLVGVSLAAMTPGLVSHLARDEAPAAEKYRDWRDQLAVVSTPLRVDRAIDRGERFLVLDFLQRQSGSPAELLGVESTDVGEGLRLDRDRAMRRANVITNRLVEVVRRPARGASQAGLQALQDELEARAGSVHGGDRAERVEDYLAQQQAEDRAATFTDVFVDLVLQASVSAARSALSTTRSLATREQVERIALAVAGHRAATGRYPQSLDELVPAWLDAVPEDPFAEEPGTPITYRVEADRVVIYSVGRDSEDDGGVDEIPDGDLVVEWPH